MRALVSVLPLAAVIILTSASLGDTIVPGGDVFGTWSAAGSPYQIQGDITVPADSVLVIEPGVDVVFQEDCALAVAGVLTAVGTAQDSIRFTAPERAEWSGLEFGENAGPIQLSYCIVERGAATGTGFDRDGGGINSIAADVSIASSTFRKNRAVGWGGALCLHAAGGAPAALSDCLFSGNHADLQGGAVYYIGPDLELTRCRFVDNFSEHRGGGVYCFAYLLGIVEINDCDFEDNGAAEDGGGLLIENRASLGITVSDCEFTQNEAGLTGGGVRMKTTSDVTVQNCVFKSNWGAQRGSAMYLDSGVSVVSGCTFDMNLASTVGALYCDGTDAEIESCTFSSNWATGSGMDLYLTNGTLSVVNTVISGNALGWPYAGLYCGSGSFSIQYCDFFKRDGGDFAGPGVPAGLGDLVGVNAVGDPCDAYSNIFLDPFFCNRENGDLRIAEDSPCLGAGESGADIGAHGIGCETLVRPTTWGGVKAMFR